MALALRTASRLALPVAATGQAAGAKRQRGGQHARDAGSRDLKVHHPASGRFLGWSGLIGGSLSHLPGRTTRLEHIVHHVGLALSGRFGHNRVRRLCRNIGTRRSEEHTSELQSLMSISYAFFGLKKKI